MKKNVILLSIFMLVSFCLFASIQENAAVTADQINAKISEMNLKWEAGFKNDFLEVYGADLQNVEEMNAILNQYRFLPEEMHKDFSKYFSKGSRMSTTDDLMWSAYVLLNPLVIDLSYFLRLEPIRDQYLFGSCWAFGALGSFESAYLVQKMGEPEGNIANNVDFSERWVGYHNINWDLAPFYDWHLFTDKDLLSGGNSYFAHYNGIRYGMIDEENAPYSDVYLTNLEGVPLPTKAYTAPKTYSTKAIIIPSALEAKDMGYTYAEYINMFKTALVNYGSVTVSYQVPSDFNAYTRGIYTPVSTVNSGGHCVTLVGWAAAADLDDIILAGKIDPEALPILDEAITEYNYLDPTVQVTVVSGERATEPASRTATEFWIVKNSWGYVWGDGGYFVIPMISEEDWDNDWVGFWEIENRWAQCALFEEVSFHDGDSLDINTDGLINENDFIALVEMVGTENAAGDISYPKDGIVTYDDVSAWVYLFNAR